MKKWWGFWIIPVAAVGVFGLCGRVSHVSDCDLSDRRQFADYEVTFCMEKRTDEVYMSQKRNSFENAEYVAVVKCVGSPENTFSAIKHKVEILQVFQGDSSIEGRSVDYLTVGSKVSGRHELFYGTYVNLMREGEYYLVCMEQIGDGCLKDSYRSPNDNNISWLPLEFFNVEIPPNPDFVAYSDVMDMDGFVKDKEGMTIIREYRSQILEKYLTGTEWWPKVQDLY
ncbi:MAG: hypothetical protein PUB22_00100 [Clostridiales bacterium]|nr:hypothetical protein [Clostridiales bacterium]